MHYEFLVEDKSGQKFLEEIIPKIVDIDKNTYRIHCYRGIGRIPGNINEDSHPRQRFLLTQLPKLLNGLGKTFAGYGAEYRACVIVVCDLDRKNSKEFADDLNDVLEACHTKPETRFCIAIEEGEAWLLGDRNAVKAAYPNLKESVIDNYEQDAICGTWELLAGAIYPGGVEALTAAGNYQEIGRAKFEWAESITPFIDICRNISPSFQSFVKNVIEVADP